MELLDKTAPTEKEILGTLKTILYITGSEEFTETISAKRLNEICKKNHIDVVMQDGLIIGFQKTPRVPKFKIELKIIQLGQDEEKEPSHEEKSPLKIN